MDEGLDQLVEELGAALAAPSLPRLQRNEPGLDRKWRAGDILVQIPRSGLESVADRLGVPVSQLRSYAEVARAYPPSERTVKAAWTVYREMRVVPAEQRRGLMHDGMTLRKARVAAGKGEMDRPKKERQTPEERAWFVIDELKEPKVKEIVEREINSSSDARKARKAAKSTLDEIAATRKFIEAELRKQKQQGSLEHQFLISSKGLLDAERYIYTVARLHDQHEEAITTERWVEIVVKLRHVAASAGDVARSIEGLAGVDYLDAEEVPEYLELGTGSDIVDAEIVGEE